MRSEALAAYEALPFPTTRDEHWRFTDLAGFDPEAFVRNGPGPCLAPDMSMLDIETVAVASVTESGITIERAPEGITFEPLADQPKLGSLVGADEKFAAHNAAVWEHGLLVVVPKGVEFMAPTYDTDVCLMAFFRDLDGNVLILHRRYAPRAH